MVKIKGQKWREKNYINIYMYKLYKRYFCKHEYVSMILESIRDLSANTGMSCINSILQF